MTITRKSISYNSLFSLLDKIYTSITGIVLIAFIVHSLGLQTYGIWVLLVTISGYIGLGNFGVPLAFEKYIAHYMAQRDMLSLQRFIVTTFYLSLGLGILLFIIPYFGAPLIFHFLLKNDSLQQYGIVFSLLVLNLALSLVSTIFVALPRGFQRFDISSVISIIGRTFYVAITVIFLLKGRGLYALVLAQFVFWAVVSLSSLLVTIKYVPGLRLFPRFFSWPLCSMVFNFGIKMEISLLSLIIVQSFDKLVMAYFLDARMVAVYDIGSKLVVFLKEIPSFLYSSITPRTSELHALDNKDNLEKIYLLGTKYLSIICIGFIAFLYPISHNLMAIWMHSDVDPFSVYVFQTLIISTMLFSTTGLGTSIAIGIGKPSLNAWSNLIMMVVNIILSLALFKIFGTRGIVWGTASGLLASSVICFYLLNKWMRIKQRDFLSASFAVPCFVNAVIVGAMVVLHGTLTRFLQPVVWGIDSNYVIVCINFIMVVLLSALLYKLLGFVTLKELLTLAPFANKFIGPTKPKPTK